MWTCFVLVVVVPIVAVTAWGTYSYRKFRRTPAAQWRTRVLRRTAELTREYHALRNAVTPSNHATVERRLFGEHLASIPAAAVQQFTGIGPGTVDRLRSAGLRTLADLIDYPFHNLAGFGPSRTADVKSAVKELLAEARHRFDASDCPKGREFQQYLQRAEQHEQTETAARNAKLAALSADLDALKPHAQVAQTITWAHFLQHGDEPIELPEVPAAPVATISPLAVTPVPPPIPVPVNVPLAAKPTPVGPLAPPRVPPPAIPKTAPKPVDLFAQALGSSGVAHQPGSEHSELLKLRTLAGFGLMIAKADGRIAKAERVAVREFLASLFSHDAVLARHIDPMIEVTEKSIPLEAVALANVIRQTTPTEQKALYLAAVKIADASGKRNRQENELLDRLAVGLGVETLPPPKSPASEPIKPLAPSPVAAPDSRRVLEIEAGVDLSAELIRRRFTLLFERADPAKAAAIGPEFATMAEKKRTDLRAAAESLIAPFGVPLDPPAAPPPPSDIRHNPDLDDIFG
ncbi:tellurite resistance TerB family protein [Limnoglobus roseus]|uniref:Co-chaperone DjlA N-terminal domain-containing protein n=1 Tax=Limnoglobus roseus TaxID=2598579 RepID=A0A5C1ABJ3_9BACT|nr:TerB family tellurite resistance protein [Limnoglobus roseus]QEL15533.1 hypothetical protein PX52LOC_02457 [Limnoglobus roseus]